MKLKVNIPVEIEIADSLVSNIVISNDDTFPDISYGCNNFTSYVKLSFNSMLNKFNNIYTCDCKTSIQNAVSRQIQEHASNIQINEMKYKADIEAKQKENEIIRNSYEEKLKNMQDRLEAQIESKDKTLTQLKENINEKIHAVFGEKERDYMILLEKKESDIKLLNYKLEHAQTKLLENNNVNTEINEIKESINRVFRNNNAITGAAGENFIYSYIKDHMILNESQIENVSGSSNACDIYLQYKSIKCGIESKNHTYPVKSVCINRFAETDIKNDNYNCGLFVSIKSEYVNVSNIKHFDVRFYHNKPVIFLSDIIRRPEHIIYAIKTLEFIVSNNSRTNNEINTIIQSVKTMVQTLDKLQRNNNSCIKSLKESNQSIEEIKNEIRKMLGEKPRAKHNCEKCEEGFEKKVEFNRHVKECSKILA